MLMRLSIHMSRPKGSEGALSVHTLVIPCVANEYYIHRVTITKSVGVTCPFCIALHCHSYVASQFAAIYACLLEIVLIPILEEPCVAKFSLY